MKSKTGSVTRNVLAGMLAIALFGAIWTEGAIQHTKSIAVGPAASEKVLQADGNGPPPPPLPTSARNAIA